MIDWPQEFRGTEVAGLVARAALDSDSRAVYELGAEGLRPYVEATWGWDDADQERRHESWWPPDEITVFEDSGAIRAFLHMTVAGDDHDIARIVVDSSLRGRGVGADIIRHVQKTAALRDANVVLQVIEGNPAIRLYERLDFKRTHVEGPKIHMRWRPEMN